MEEKWQMMKWLSQYIEENTDKIEKRGKDEEISKRIENFSLGQKQ